MKWEHKKGVNRIGEAIGGRSKDCSGGNSQQGGVLRVEHVQYCGVFASRDMTDSLPFTLHKSILIVWS